MHLAATNGFSGGYARTGHSLQAVAICGEGTAMERDYAFESRSHRADLPDPAEVGRLAGERAAARAGAAKPPTGAWPVLYDERVASGLIGHLVQAINGAAVARGASWLKDAMGEPVLPRGIDLVEDPLPPAHRRLAALRRRGAAHGAPRARRGRRAQELDPRPRHRPPARPQEHRQRRPRHLGAALARRSGNLTLTPGHASAATGSSPRWATGLLVTALIGASINPTTGDYSRGASGFWVESGEIVRPVNECTVAGNLRDMLRTIRPANDARPHRSRLVPSLLVEGLVIAGS